MVFVLKALIPYSRESMMLAFKPSRFFYELEKTSSYKRKTIQNTYYRARQQNFIETSSPRLTIQGRQHIQPFVAERLAQGGHLMVIFDVPEAEANLRRQFRLALRHLDFEQVQQSVWMSRYDHRDFLEELIGELGLGDCVQIYEAARLYP